MDKEISFSSIDDYITILTQYNNKDEFTKAFEIVKEAGKIAK